MLRGVLRPLLLLLRTKPPVGALLLLQAYQLLRRKSILEDASSFFPTSRRRSRSLSLDTGDREYEHEGGVHFVRVELYRVLLADAMARSVARGMARELRGVPTGAAAADAAAADAATADASTADDSTADDSAAGAANAGAASAGGGGGTSLDERWWRHCERLYTCFGWRGTATAGGTGSSTEEGAEAEAEEEEAEAKEEEEIPPKHRRGEEEIPPAEAAEQAHLEAMAAGLGLSCGPAVSRQAFVRRSGEQLAALRATRQALEALQALEPPQPSPQADTRGGGEGAPGASAPVASAELDQLPCPVGGPEELGHVAETIYMGHAVETLLELRAADALTRLLRDQMMRSAVVLEHAQARATYYGSTYYSPGGHRSHVALPHYTMAGRRQGPRAQQQLAAAAARAHLARRGSARSQSARSRSQSAADDERNAGAAARAPGCAAAAAAHCLLLTTYCSLLTTQVRCSGCCSLGRRRCRHRPSSAAAVAAAGRAGWAGRTGRGSQRGWSA